MKIEKYIIHKDLTVTVNGNVDISRRRLTEIPIQFKHVNGHFFCEENQLTSLKGIPSFITGGLCVHENQIESLDYFPETVIGEIILNDNKIKSLKGISQNHSNSLSIANNPIESLEYAPLIIKGNLNISNTQIKFDYKKIQIEGLLTIRVKSEEIIEELSQYYHGFVNGKDREIKTILFEGPFSEYKRIMQKKDLLIHLSNSLENTKSKSQFKM